MDELVIIEVKRRKRKEGSGKLFWRDVLRSMLLALAHYPVS